MDLQVDSVESAAKLRIGGGNVWLNESGAGTQDARVNLGEKQARAETNVGDFIAVSFRNALNQTVKA